MGCFVAEFVQEYTIRLGVDGLEGKPTVVAVNKMDLLPTVDLIESVASFDGAADVVGLSCKTSSGLKDIIGRIEKELKLM